MPTSYTSLLGLAQPASGELTGTWGTVVNDNVTAYLDSAIAGAQVISGTLTAVTLSKTTGSNLSQAGTGSTGSSQYQIIRCTGAPASLLTITVPATDKTYVIINATSTSQSVKIVGAGPTTGITIASGKTSIVAWNGSDFVEVSPSTATTATNLAGGSIGQVPYQSAAGTTALLAVGTSGQVLTSSGAGAPTWTTPSSGGGSTKTISNKTSAYTIVSGDLGTIINCTSGTFTVSLTAAASLGSGFTCTIWNTGAGTITIDPAGAETIDGVATLILRQGEGTDIVSNGTNWETSYKKTMRGYAENFASNATRPIVTGNAAFAIGYGSSVTNNNALALGYQASSSGTASIALGKDCTSSVAYGTTIGNNSSGAGSQAATGLGAMALGGSYASGTDSFAAAIGSNTSSYGANNSGNIALGTQCKSSGAFNAVAMGGYSIASGGASIAMGYINQATGDYACAIGGGSNLASGQYSVALGRYAIAAQIGKYSFASGSIANAGDAQYGLMVLRAATTTTTAVALTSDGAAATTTNQLIVASGKAMAISGTLIAKQTASGNMAGWTITGIVSNNAGTMAVSGLALTAIGTDSIGLGASPTIAVDNTNKGVTITSGYKAATSIRWVANVQTSEVTYA
jgi:hypothetical protein